MEIYKWEQITDINIFQVFFFGEKEQRFFVLFYLRKGTKETKH